MSDRVRCRIPPCGGAGVSVRPPTACGGQGRRERTRIARFRCRPSSDGRTPCAHDSALHATDAVIYRGSAASYEHRAASNRVRRRREVIAAVHPCHLEFHFWQDTRTELASGRPHFMKRLFLLVLIASAVVCASAAWLG